MVDIDRLKSEGIWNNDWEASQELIYRYFELQGKQRSAIALNYSEIVHFFQARYRGTDPINWNGYITTEPILIQTEYTELLDTHQIGCGFFSGATRGSAEYILKQRLGLQNPVLVAMEDAPGKPDPTGLIAAIKQIEFNHNSIPVLYVGDTVADMYTIVTAREIQPERSWIGVGVLPPHVQSDPEFSEAYTTKLKQAGAAIVYSNVQQLTPSQIEQLLSRG
jgi:HAD superfamily phosphatase